MFGDLAVLISDQGAQLTTVDQHIVLTAERAREGARELAKAERSQRAARNRCLCLALAAAAVLSVLMIILFA
jgi:syntaxin 7